MCSDTAHRFSVRLLVWLSGLFPPQDLSRYGDEDAYSRWQFACARRSWDALAARRIDLNGKTVVDLGCGEGGKTLFYASRGASWVLGIDCRLPSLLRARAFARRAAQDDCAFVVARAESSGLCSRTFDIVVSDDAFEHYPDPEAVLCEAGRLLREGGLLVVQFTPYWGPTGPHLYDFIRLPYAHLLFKWETMEQAVNLIASRMEDERAGDSLRRGPRVMARQAIEQMHHFINRMSVRRFKWLLRSRPGWELVHLHRYAVSRRQLPFVLVRNLPVIEELGGHLFVVLRKSTGARITRRSFRAAATRLDSPRLLPPPAPPQEA